MSSAETELKRMLKEDFKDDITIGIDEDFDNKMYGELYMYNLREKLSKLFCLSIVVDIEKKNASDKKKNREVS